MATKPETTKPSQALVMPQSFIQQLAMPSIVNTSSVRSPYVVMPSKIAKAYPKYMAAIPGLKEFDPVLCMPDGSMSKLSPFKFSILNGYQFWADTNASGDFIDVSFEEVRGWKEHIDLNVFLYLPGRVLLARIGVATTKCPAFRSAIDELKKAMDDVEWSKMGLGHAQTVKLNLPPNLRFFTVCTLGNPQVSKTSGNVYVSTEGEHSPTGAPEWEMIGTYMKDTEAFNEDMVNINEDTVYRMNFLKTFAEKKKR